MDGITGLAGAREISSTSSEILMEKVREVLERNLKKDSRELILLIRDDYCYGILNYPESEKESIRRSMKSSLTQMEIQKKYVSACKLFHGSWSSIQRGRAFGRLYAGSPKN